MSTTFVSKNRRVRFDLTLRIVDLNNVPLVSGTSFIKWHLPSSNAAEHRGRTAKCAIRDHRVQFGYEKKTPVRLVVGRDSTLQECSIHFEVLQEYSAGGRGERIVLGHIRLNLAEYVEASEHGAGVGVGVGVESAAAAGSAMTMGEDGGGVTRRYLMQESKINSTLKIGVAMRYLEGTREYVAPPLRSAPVFGGIAGIMSSAEPPDVGSSTSGTGINVSSMTVGGSGSADAHDGTMADAVPQPSNLNSRNKEAGEVQDMYRRTLAAYWASQPGELKADECIEDIFAGGDGWGRPGKSQNQHGQQQQQHHRHHHNHHHSRHHHHNHHHSRHHHHNHHHSRHHHHHQQQQSVESPPQQPGSGSGSSTPTLDAESMAPPPRPTATANSTATSGNNHLAGRGMMEMQKSSFGKYASKSKAPRTKGAGELSEMDVRPDLVGWRIGERA